MLMLLTALGFFESSPHYLGWEKITEDDGTIMLCLISDEINEKAEKASEHQFLNIECDFELEECTQTYLYCLLAPMNDSHYYGPKAVN